MKRFVIPFALLAGAVVFWFTREPTASIPPRPTEYGSHEDFRNSARLQWLERMHRAAPNRDWRDVERQNWGAHRARRNQLLKRAEDTFHWTEQGSINQAGRTFDTALSPDGATLYTGSARGGLWRASIDPDTPDFGSLDWEPISDGVFGGAHNIVILNDGTLLFSDDAVHYSTDQGITWEKSVNEAFDNLISLAQLIKVNNSQETLFVTGRSWHWDNGWDIVTKVYRSDDHGRSFFEVLDLGFRESWLWTSRVAEGPLYTVFDNKLQRSDDLGDSWTAISDLPGSSSDTMLVGSEAGAPTFYLYRHSSTRSQLYRSDDGGNSWTDLGVLNPDVWDRGLETSPTDPNLVLYGEVDCFRSINGGQTFARVNGWADYYADVENKLHADMRGFDFLIFPDGTERLFIATDGGTYVSEDGAATVKNISLNGLNVSQYYDTLTNQNNPDWIATGSQDQGYQYGRLSSAGPAALEQVISGDYGHIVSSDGSHDTVYSVYPGFMLITTHNEEASQWYEADFPSNEDLDWMPFIMADRDNGDIVYMAGRAIHRYTRQGSSWRRVTHSIDLNPGSGERVSAMAMAHNDTNRIYAVTSNGELWVSDNRGVNWTEKAGALPGPHYFYGSFLWISPHDDNTVIMAGSGYSNPGVWLSRDGGTSFEALGSNQPATLFFEVVAETDEQGVQTVYAAADSGPYRYDAATDQWQSILGTQGPSTTYWSVEMVGDRVRFGTYGRGVWDFHKNGKKRALVDIVEKPRVVNRRNDKP